jgi:thiopurine S-methyltransferase
MQQEFWLERWQNNEIGFHADEINLHLQHFWPELKLSADSEVFVPLCGKSKDMLWLHSQNHAVLGVELSPLAIAAFCNENDLTAKTTEHGAFNLTQINNIKLYCGNFFDLTPKELSGINAVYDRAALVALPAELRQSYAYHLKNSLPAGVKILLITFDYNQQEMAGPPFSVAPTEVIALYGYWCDIQLLSSKPILEQEPRFQARGLTHLQEHVFLLTVQ